MASVLDKSSLKYHDIFDYPLTKADLFRWKIGTKFKIKNLKLAIKHKNGFYFISGREEIIKKRIENEKHSFKKIKIARKSARLISKIPTVVFLGLTGALAMNNAGKNSDIDFLIITKKDTLWLTRFWVYLLLKINGHNLRKPGLKNEKDKLCLNMWLDESNLVWDKRDRNIYTAHEIAQIRPLFSRNKIYQKFLYKNTWVLDYWPNAVKINRAQLKINNTKSWVKFFNKIAFVSQYLYMKEKITREVVTPTRAIFHPNDWGKRVLTRLRNFG